MHKLPAETYHKSNVDGFLSENEDVLIECYLAFISVKKRIFYI